MFDLDSRLSRIEREQIKRRQDAKKKLLNEQQMRDSVEEDRVRREMELQRKREEDEQEQARLRWEMEEDLRVTGGVSYEEVLAAYPMEGDDDKVKLPEEALQRLSRQDAFSRGALTFRLQQIDCHSNQRAPLLPYHHHHQQQQQQDTNPTTIITSVDGPVITFCGVREFSSPEGMIGLPPKVLRSLQLTDIDHFIKSPDNGSSTGTADEDSAGSAPAMDSITTVMIRIKYMILPKCAFARLRPREHRFFDVSLVKLCLEENLKHHSTLSVGDELSVWSRGVEHHLIVTELKPEQHCSLVNTDVEIEMELSEEYTTHRCQQQTVGDGDRSRTRNSTSTISEGVPSEASSSSQSVGDHQKLLEFYSNQLRPEPPTHTTNAANTTADVGLSRSVLSLKIKLPDGASRVRRFHADTSIYELFLFAALQLLSTSSPNSSVARTVLMDSTNSPGSDNIVDKVLARLQVSTRFPARNIKLLDPPDNRHRTFEQLGMMMSASESVFVTLI